MSALRKRPVSHRKMLALELTESVAVNVGEKHPNYSIVCLSLRGNGVRLAIDDFGTGESSFVVRSNNSRSTC